MQLKAKTFHGLDFARRAGVIGVGEQLRAECAATEQPIPGQLATLLKQLDGAKPYRESAAVRLAIINTVVRVSSVPNELHASLALTGPAEGSSATRRSSNVSLPSRRATALGRFEKLMLDMIECHLTEPERSAAIEIFSAYVRVFHAMLDLGLITERELRKLPAISPPSRLRDRRLTARDNEPRASFAKS
jgi:hypothetical protein